MSKTTTKPTAPAALKPPTNKTLEKLYERFPPPSALRERAYRSQFTDALCVKEGARTKAELVIREAAAWAVVIADALGSKSTLPLSMPGKTPLGRTFDLRVRF